MDRYDFYEGEPEEWRAEPAGRDWFSTLRNVWQWDELVAEISHESQARVAIIGADEVGKQSLLSRLRGWSAADEEETAAFELWEGVTVETFGLFLLVNVPERMPEGLAQAEFLLALGEPLLLIYLIDASANITVADYRWIATLRAAGRPLLLVANKIDLVEEPEQFEKTAVSKLGMPTTLISAKTGEGIESTLLPIMLDTVPRLAVPLGREVTLLRRKAAGRIIKQGAILSGVIGVQPIPLLDLPFQIMVQMGVLLRVGAAYGYMPTGGGLNWRLVGAILGSFGSRYGAQAVIKLIPLVGWLAAGVLSGSMTLLLGETAVRYYEAGGTVHFSESLVAARQSVQRRAARWREGKGEETLVDELIEVRDVS